ncbi:MAG: hypothetical protein ACOCYC_04330 [bacterium]
MNRKDFLLHLIGEMGHYILDREPNRMVISLHQEPDGVHLAVLDSVQRDETELEDIRASLNSARRPELAGYYGSMAGYDSLGDARLNLIGWQLKGADVKSTDSGTKIDLWLGGEGFNPAHFSIDEEVMSENDEG